MPRLTLAQQIAQLDEPPPEFDPEDVPDAVNGANAQDEDTNMDNAGEDDAREHYLEVGPSSLRKLQQPNVLDPKYDGVRISRNRIFDDDEDEEQEEEGDYLTDESEDKDSQSQEDEDEQSSESRDRYNNQLDDGGDSQEGEEDAEESSGDEAMQSKASPESGSRLTAPADGEPSDLVSTLRRTRDTDRIKGRAVMKQLALWDNLLDSRIRLQKGVRYLNNLPASANIPLYLKDPECRDSAEALLEEVISFSEELFELQETLLVVNNESSLPPRKRRRVEKPSDIDLSKYNEEIQQSCNSFAELQSSYHPHLIQTLHKWSQKILSVAPSALLPAKRGGFSKASQSPKSVVDLIDDALRDPKVLQRSKVRRIEGVRIGPTSITETEGVDGVDEMDDTVDDEIFDDTDFYQGLLRDIIGTRENVQGTDSLGEYQQKKKKKVVDTKASKGRKLRYEPHEKLINFMVPIPHMKGAWHEEQIDELFASLLGKGYDDDRGDDLKAGGARESGTMEPEAGIVVDAGLLNGLRVF